jgi:hypothetical protein
VVAVSFAIIWADKKLGPATVNAKVYIGGRSKATAEVYAYSESDNEWVSCGKRVFYYRMVPAEEIPEPLAEGAKAP